MYGVCSIIGHTMCHSSLFTQSRNEHSCTQRYMYFHSDEQQYRARDDSPFRRTSSYNNRIPFTSALPITHLQDWGIREIISALSGSLSLSVSVCLSLSLYLSLSLCISLSVSVSVSHALLCLSVCLYFSLCISVYLSHKSIYCKSSYSCSEYSR